MLAGNFIHDKKPILSISDLYAALNKERARTDRTGLSFSIILIEINSRKKIPSVRTLASLVASRVRSVDVVGWFDKNHLAILLPSTNLDGCRELAKTIVSALNVRKIHPAVSFFSYPAQKLELQLIWEKSSLFA